MVGARILRIAMLLSVSLGGVLAAGGCGGDDGRGEVAPQAWARDVCQALTPWRSELDALMARAQQRMDSAAGPAQAKAGLVELLGGAEAASEQARARVAGAGEPDADNGRRVAAEFTDSLERTRDAYGRAKRAIAALPTTDAKAFYDAVASTFVQLTKDYGAPDLQAVGSRDLKSAFDQVPACQ